MKKSICGIIALCLLIMPLTGCNSGKAQEATAKGNVPEAREASSGHYAPYTTDFFLSVYERAIAKQEEPDGEKTPEAEEEEKDAEALLGVKLDDVKVSDTLKEQIKENPVTKSPEKKPQPSGGSSATQGNTGGSSARPTQPATQPAAQKPTNAPKPTEAPKPPVTQPPAPKPTEAPKPPATQPPAPKPTDPPKPPATQPPTQPQRWGPTATLSEINSIVAEYRAYGESLGMIWDDTATKDNASWNVPMRIRAYATKEKFRQDMKDELNWVKDGGDYFKIYIEPYENTWEVYVFY